MSAGQETVIAHESDPAHHQLRPLGDRIQDAHAVGLRDFLDAILHIHFGVIAVFVDLQDLLAVILVVFPR